MDKNVKLISEHLVCKFWEQVHNFYSPN